VIVIDRDSGNGGTQENLFFKIERLAFEDQLSFARS